MVSILNKFKTIIISLIITVVVFISLIAVEKTLVKYTPTVKVVYCIKDIKRKEQLNPDNFILKDVPITSIDINTVKSINEIKDMYAKENIYANEVLNKNRIGSQSEVESYTLNEGEREMAITFENLADCVGGTIRKDDRIDIVFTLINNSNPLLCTTQSKLQGIRVLGAVDSTGKYIDSFDKNTPAVTLIIAAKPEECLLIENLQRYGKIKALKLPDKDKAYPDIIIQNGVAK